MDRVSDSDEKGYGIAACARLLMLFFVLIAIKGLMLVHFREYINLTSWRINPHQPSLGLLIEHLAFVGIGLFSLFALRRHCDLQGVRTVRAANMMILFFGLMLVILTSNSDGQNYLYLLLTKRRNLMTVGQLLCNDLLFRRPYLLEWMVAYCAVYFMLMCARCESNSLYLTALAAGAYAMLLGDPLQLSSDEWLLIDILGVISLVLLRFSSDPFPLIVLLVPVGWTLSLLVLELTIVSNAYAVFCFMIFAGLSVFIFSIATEWSRYNTFYKPWSSLVLFYFTSFLFCVVRNFPGAQNIDNQLRGAIEAPRYFLGESAICAGLGVIVVLLWRSLSKCHIVALDICNFCLIAMSVADLRLSSIMGVRLDWDVIRLANGNAVLRSIAIYLTQLCFGILASVTMYFLLVRLMTLQLRRLGPTLRGSRSVLQALYIAGGFCLLGVLGLMSSTADKLEGETVLRLVRSSPVWKRAVVRKKTRQQLVDAARGLGLINFGSTPNVQRGRDQSGLNVLFVLMESEYNKYLSLFGAKIGEQPMLAAYSNRMEIFPNFFSDFAASDHARFACFSGLFPVSDYNEFTLKRVPVRTLFEVLHENGYYNSIYYSSFFDYLGFGDFLKGREIDEMFDADTMPGRRTSERISWGLREDETVVQVCAAIKGFSTDHRRFFLTYIPAAPHFPYDGIPGAFQTQKVSTNGSLEPFYRDSLRYMDRVIASILNQLKDCGLLDRTLVVLVADHGEMFGGNGGPIGHGWRVTPELTNVPLIVLDPERPGFRINYTVGSQVDLLPSILDRLGVSIPTSQLYEGISLFAPERAAHRTIYLNSYEEYGLIQDNHFFWGSRELDDSEMPASQSKGGYTIFNKGGMTMFTKDRSLNRPATSIKDFEAFQSDILQNYLLYSRIMGPSN